MTKERRKQIYQTVNRGWFSNILGKNEIVELLAEADELERVKAELDLVARQEPVKRCEAFLRVKGLWKEGAQ